VVPPVTNNCNSTFSFTKNDIKQRLANNKTTKASRQSAFNSLIDNGNTTLLLSRIDTTTSTGANNLKNLLVSYSPYLSYDVIFKVCSLSVMTNSQVFTVLNANSHSARNYSVPVVLKLRSTPMPDSLINILTAHNSTISNRDTLAFRLSDLKRENKFLINQLVELHINDTTYNGVDSAIVALRPHKELWASYRLIALYNEREWPDSARRLVDSIPSYYKLRGSDLTNYTDFKYIFRKADSLNVFKNIYRWHNLSVLDVIHLQGIASSNPYQPGKQACNILKFIGVDTCDTEIALDVAPRFANPYDDDVNYTEPNKKGNAGLKLYPNPTDGSFNVQYYLPEIEDNTILEMYNITGNLVYKQNIYSKQGNITLNLDLSKGMYLLVLRQNNKPLLYEKLILN
jgi:hypothetical protein